MNALNRLLIGVACSVIIVAGMRAASDIVGFVLFAGLLATCISPLVESLVRHGLTRSLALLITILVVIVGGLALAAVLGASVVRLVQALPTYQMRLEEVMASLQGLLDRFGLHVGEFLTHEVLNPQQVITLATVLLGGVLNITRTALFLFLFVALMLVELVGYEAKVGSASSGMAARLFEVRQGIRKFVSITALMGLITAVADVILLVILGVDSPLMWGVLAFLFNFIPVIGGLLAMLPPFVLALLEFGWTKALIVVIGFVLINNLVDNVLKPKLMRQGLDISILVIFLSLLFWNWVLGPSGAILAIPLTLLIKRCVAELVAEPHSP
jgi:AI-2 transport protein TqsA